MIYDLNEYIINKTKVYSLDLGEGEITSVFKLYDGISDYFEVSFEKEGVTKYISTSRQEEIRIASSLNKLSHALVNLGEKINSDEFSFELDYYNTEVTKIDILYIVNVIASLTGQEKLSKQDRHMLASCINSLVQEVSGTYKTSIKNAKGIVSDHMRYA